MSLQPRAASGPAEKPRFVRFASGNGPVYCAETSKPVQLLSSVAFLAPRLAVDGVCVFPHCTVSFSCVCSSSFSQPFFLCQVTDRQAGPVHYSMSFKH